jgi:hypothetical protein
MGARKKLNGAFLTGSLVTAGLAGLVSGSWLVFGLGLALLVGIDCVSGNIRSGGKRS